MEPLPFAATLERYQSQADALLAGCRAGDGDAIREVREHHPDLRDPPASDVRIAAIGVDDARLVVAREYGFEGWPELAAYAGAVADEDSSAARFEAAVEAVVSGDVETLASLLAADPELVRARSLRGHHATLLHYVAANGVEGYRQESPANAVDVARLLLDSGAEPDALADMYGGRYATMSMLVSSAPPAKAGVQVGLVETLLDHGAAVEGLGSPLWRSPLMTALAFGHLAAAEALVRRGARVDNVAAAAGLGRAADAARLLPSADADSRHRALALAAQHGHVEIVRLLLDAGEDPDRYNPEGAHSHSVPLHQAVWSDHADVVRLLVERGARLDVRDRVYHATPLGWAVYGGRTEIEAYLRSRSAPEE